MQKGFSLSSKLGKAVSFHIFCSQILNPLPYFESCRSDFCQARLSKTKASPYSAKSPLARYGLVGTVGENQEEEKSVDEELATTLACVSAAAFVRQCRFLGVDVNRGGGWRGVDFCREKSSFRFL